MIIPRSLTQITEYDSAIHSNPQFKPTLETNASINVLYPLLLGTNQDLEIEVYRKPTSTDRTTHYNSNHPIEHKVAAYRFIPSRMHQLPLTAPYIQKEWNTIQHIAKVNVFPYALFINLKAQISQKLTLPSTKD